MRGCRHGLHVVRIIFDAGNERTSIYELCKYCKEYEIYQKNILNIENITESMEIKN